MKILTILAHDKKNSLNHYLFETTIKYLQAKGHDLTVVDLYKHHREIPFYMQEQKSASTTNTSFDDYPFVATCKKQFLEADAIVLFFPVYCFSVPAILKAWIDLLAQFAAEKQAGALPKPLHHIKNLFVVATMGMPWIAKVFWARNCIKKYFNIVFSFIGIKHIQLYEITSVEKVNPGNVHKHLTAIQNNLETLFKERC